MSHTHTQNMQAAESYSNPVARPPPIAGNSFSVLPSQSSRSAFNASALAALVQSSLNLKDYEWTEQERPLIAHNQFENDQLIPVIDIGSLIISNEKSSLSGEIREQEEVSCIAEMAKASQEWGFFQVINHGVSEELIKKMEKHAREFFDLLGFEEKKAVLRDANTSKPMGYACGGAGTRLKSALPWMESLQLPCVTTEMEAYAWKIWQDGNTDFRNVAREFSQALKGLTLRILEVLIGQLGIKMDVLGDHLQQGRNSVIRFNYYPPCPEPSLMLGLGAHSDPHLLTVLHQDLVGGLQICKDGLWIAVKPRSNSFVVNIGDALQVWSNDLYKSVEHRAVCNSMRSRLSMAFFLNPIDEATITPATKDPPLYMPFTWKEYREYMYAHRPRGKSNLLRFMLPRVLSV